MARVFNASNWKGAVFLMSGLLAIQGVSGSTPNYSLTVVSSAGVVSGDHVVAPKLSGVTHGGIYRVTSVPDGATILVTDDLKPGGGIYGAPTLGRSGYWTPHTSGISTSKFNGTPFWGDVTERDLLILRSGLDASVKSGVLIPSNFSGNPKTATILFGTQFPSTSYSVTTSSLTDGKKSYGPVVENKTVAGFTVNLHSNNISGLVEVGWHAIVTGD